MTGKRIGFAVTNDISMDQRMGRICRALNDHGYSVEITGRRRKKSLPLPDQPYDQQRLRCLFNKGPLFYLEFQIRLLFVMLFRPRCHIYGAVDLDTLPAMWLISKIRRSKLLFDSHEIFEEVPELSQKPFVRFVWRQVGKWMVPSASYCWTVNQSLADRFKKDWKKDFVVIRNLPVADLKRGVNEKIERLILYQGRVNVGRGLEEAIETMRFLPDFKLVIAGGGDIENQLRYRVYKLGLKNVEFTGELKPEELQEYTAKAWLGLNLLDDRSGNYYYSLANKFFDYMAFGVPSLSMDFPEYRLINEEYNFSVLLPGISPLEICRAVEKLHSDPDRYASLSRNASLAYEVLNWENESKKAIRSIQ